MTSCCDCFVQKFGESGATTAAACVLIATLPITRCCLNVTSSFIHLCCRSLLVCSGWSFSKCPFFFLRRPLSFWSVKLNDFVGKTLREDHIDCIGYTFLPFIPPPFLKLRGRLAFRFPSTTESFCITQVWNTATELDCTFYESTRMDQSQSQRNYTQYTFIT